MGLAMSCNPDHRRCMSCRGVLNTPDPQIYLGLIIGIWASLELDFTIFSIFDPILGLFVGCLCHSCNIFTKINTFKAFYSTGQQIHSSHAYSSGVFNDVDILTDSTGIWVVYTNEESQGYIILVKLNPVTLSKEYSTRLNTKQETLMNCFMVGYRA